MVKRRLDSGPVHTAAAGGEPFAQHLPPAVEAQERHMRRAIDLGEAFPESDKGGVEVRRHAERVRE
jgi:hypothetical protein